MADNEPKRYRPNYVWPLIILALLVIFGLLMWNGLRTKSNQNTNNQTQTNQEFGNEVNSDNFEKSLPNHGETTPGAPVYVFVQTNTTSTSGSKISVNKDNKDYGSGNTFIDLNGQVLRRAMDSNAPDGIYTVNYQSCSQNNQCQNGNFKFKIDRTNRANYENLKNRNQINISIANGNFNPGNIIVSKGTKITWTNNDNTVRILYPGVRDGGNLYPDVSSGNIEKGKSFSFTVNMPGYYTYYSPNGSSTIIGNVIVE